MKLKKLEKTISELFISDEFEVGTEFVTPDNARIDLTVHRYGDPFLAVEFEESYKWMRARVLYDSIKADRSGFDHVVIVYPFEQRGLKNGWIWDFIERDLCVKSQIIKPSNIKDIRQLG